VRKREEMVEAGAGVDTEGRGAEWQMGVENAEDAEFRTWVIEHVERRHRGRGGRRNEREGREGSGGD
jgi:hypothetical protein